MLKRICIALAAPFAWRRVRLLGVRYGGNVWAYYENRLTGQRKAVRRLQRGHQPIDMIWLRGGASWRIEGQYPNTPFAPPTPGRPIPPPPPRG